MFMRDQAWSKTGETATTAPHVLKRDAFTRLSFLSALARAVKDFLRVGFAPPGTAVEGLRCVFIGGSPGRALF